MNNITKATAIKLGIMLFSAAAGYTIYGQPSVSVGVSVPLPSVEVQIHTESDFYEPLTPHGEWVVVGSYGRCWRPGHVARDWRPYCNGNWQRTDAGWYWVSDEPWAWATYHYGRWDFTDQYGWYWVPQVQWAPAWVSWHEGGGYVGWAPLQPSVSISVGGFVGFNQSHIPPRAFVFVEQRRFMDPVRPTTVVVNNTTIINKTVNITNTKIVNNTVIIGGPETTVIEKASGRKVQAVQVRELRQKEEAPIAAKQRTAASTVQKKAQTPVRSEAPAPATKVAAARPLPQVQTPAAATPERGTAPAPRNHEVQSETHKPAPAAPELKTETRAEAIHPAANRQAAEPKADKHSGQPAKPARPSENKAPRPAQEKPAPRENNAPNPSEKPKE